MSETVQQPESQKTIVAFIAGLLIGGLMAWVFTGGTNPAEAPAETGDEPSTEESAEMNDEAGSTPNEESTPEATDEEEVAPVATMETGTGAITVTDQAAGNAVAIDGAVFPNDEGWIGVRDYENGQLTGLLGVARFSKEQGLVPEAVPLLRATEAGQQYAVVFYTESGDREFSLANDVQIPDVMTTFTAE
jgi:hypothetical protein